MSKIEQSHTAGLFLFVYSCKEGCSLKFDCVLMTVLEAWIHYKGYCSLVKFMTRITDCFRLSEILTWCWFLSTLQSETSQMCWAFWWESFCMLNRISLLTYWHILLKKWLECSSSSGEEKLLEPVWLQKWHFWRHSCYQQWLAAFSIVFCLASLIW